MNAIKANYRRLREQGEARDMQEVETLLGQVFLWALLDSQDGVAALRDFGDTFRLDGIYGEAEGTYREMYTAITGRRLSDARRPSEWRWAMRSAVRVLCGSDGAQRSVTFLSGHTHT
jgi:hypothetical protein